MVDSFPQSTFADCIEKLAKMKKAKATFPGYITHIRFPLFKNLANDLRVDFQFPVTALVGPNGSGKSSVLHALYGAPRRKSTGDFWFGTEVDPITEGDGQPNRFIYGYFHEKTGLYVETRKARVSKKIKGKANPNYWEPTKIAPGDNMEEIPEKFLGKKIEGLSKDRWNPVSRQVFYMNFRSSLSAFDKYFYFGVDPGLKRLEKKRDLILRDSKLLRDVIDSGDTSVVHYKKPIASIHRHLTDIELNWVRYILGRNYKSARLIQHDLFKGKSGLSIQFEVGGKKYSEAFAGSGEVAVASAVVQILALQNGALVLLDEPEVSLHPQAQTNLLHFLLDIAKQKKLQIVFSTHAPNMVAPLPDEAIKVFIQDPVGKFAVLPESHPYAAFRRLGFNEAGEVRVIVEDRLAKYVVDIALRNLSEDERKLFMVEYPPGGADAILKHRIPNIMLEKNFFVYLDGDKRTGEEFVDPDQLARAKDPILDNIIRKQVGVSPQIIADGSGGVADKKQQAELRRKYLSFVRSSLRYLPRRCPEEIVLEGAISLKAEGEIASSEAAKAQLAIVAKAQLGDAITADEIDQFARMKLAENRAGNADITAIENDLRYFLKCIRPSA